MMHRTFQQRQHYSEAERRMCFMSPNNPNIPDFIETSAAAVADFATEWGKYGLEKSIDGTDALYDQFHKFYNADTREAFRQQSLQHAAQFYDLASPEMLNLVRQQLQREPVTNFADLADMLDHAKWTDAFSKLGIFDDAMVPMKPFTTKNGPLGLVEGLSAAERKELFAGYVDRFVPIEVQEMHQNVFGHGLDRQARIDAIAASSGTINESMKGMIGVADLQQGTVENTIASNALTHRYRLEDLVVNGVTVQSRPHLDQDFDHSPRYSNIDELKNARGSSLLKGAARIGVLTEEDVAMQRDRLTHQEREEAIVTMSAAQQLDQLGQVTKRELAREAQTMTDVWHNLGGFEKLALVAAGLFALRSEPGQKLAMGGAVYYFGAKFFAKQERPFEIFEKMSVGATDRLFNLPGVKDVRESLGMLNAMDTEMLQKRAEIVTTFFSQEAREELDAAVVGSMILADMPLNELSKYVEIGPGVTGIPGDKGVLRTWDPSFRKSAKAILTKRGVDPRAADKFFNDSSQGAVSLDEVTANRLGVGSLTRSSVETGDGLATVYYRFGMRIPGREADVQFVEEARNMRGGSYSALPLLGASGEEMTINGRTAKPLELFYDIALLGLANASSQTLGDFMETSILAVRTVDEGQDVLEESRFLRKKNQLEAHNHRGESAGMTAIDRGNMVEVGQEHGAGVLYPILIPKAEFMDMQIDTIASKWIEPLVGKYKIDFQNLNVPTYTEFDFKRDPQDFQTILYGAVLDATQTGYTMPIAATSAYELFKHDPQEIYNAYHAREQDPVTPLADRENPFD